MNNKNKIVLGNCIYLSDVDKKQERTIEIVFATDNNYVSHCAAAIASILLNADKSSNFNFHILDGGISEENKNKLYEMQHLRSFDIQFYDMKKFDFSSFPLNRDYISVATYYRLFLLDILPSSIKKVIYLDCDIIVEKDLKNLWDIDISDYLAGVVEDEGSLNQIKRLNLPLQNNYFNAGILVLNIEKLRTFDFKQKCFDYYLKNSEIIILQDQDILNGVLNGYCKYLPLNYNTNGRIYIGSKLETIYTKQDALNAKNNPFILHFSDIHKPWMPTCKHPLWMEYFKYLKYTPFNCNLNKHILKRIMHKIKCFFSPKNLFSLENEYSFGAEEKFKIVTICFIKFKFKLKNYKKEG